MKKKTESLSKVNRFEENFDDRRPIEVGKIGLSPNLPSATTTKKN